MTGDARGVAGQRTRYWQRLNHEGLGMPLPTVYVPMAHLPPKWPLKRRFVDIVHRDENADLPIITGLSADIADPAGMQLLAVQIDPGQDRRAGTLTASSFTQVADGHYTEPSTRAWREHAYAGGMIIIALGRPLVQPSITTPFEMLFTEGSRMGVVPLVMPAPM